MLDDVLSKWGIFHRNLNYHPSSKSDLSLVFKYNGERCWMTGGTFPEIKTITLKANLTCPWCFKYVWWGSMLDDTNNWGNFPLKLNPPPSQQIWPVFGVLSMMGINAGWCEWLEKPSPETKTTVPPFQQIWSVTFTLHVGVLGINAWWDQCWMSWGTKGTFPPPETQTTTLPPNLTHFS